MDWTELMTTLSLSWAILAVAGAGILALPWSAEELGATRHALTHGLSLLVGRHSSPEPIVVHEAVLADA
jgi:hypothetical protein